MTINTMVRYGEQSRFMKIVCTYLTLGNYILWFEHYVYIGEIIAIEVTIVLGSKCANVSVKST